MSDFTSALLTIRDAAKYLAVSERTIWTLLKSKKLPAVRFGKISRIMQNDLDTFIRECRGQQA